jgi:hypothetical protein
MNRLNNFHSPKARQELIYPRARILTPPLKPTRAQQAPALLGLGGLLLFIGLIAVIGLVSNSAPSLAVHPTPTPQPSPTARPTPEAQSWAPRAILVHHMTEAEYQRRKQAHELTVGDVNRHDRGE